MRTFCFLLYGLGIIRRGVSKSSSFISKILGFLTDVKRERERDGIEEMRACTRSISSVSGV